MSAQPPNSTTISADIRLVDPSLIDQNPYQPADRRVFQPADLQDLASVRDSGLLQTPIVRVHPQDAARFQMIDGWRRRAAWLLFRPGEPLPVMVKASDDATLFADMIIANVARLNLNDLQKIELLKRATKEFGMTQLAAGKLIGLATQSAVSNLLGLDKLPSEVKQLIAEGKLAQRNARALRTLEKLAPKKVVEIAQASVSQDNPEAFIDDAITELLTDKGCDLSHAPFPLGWPLVPIPLAQAINSMTELIACKGCPFFFVRDDDPRCGNKDCYALKCAQAMPEHLAKCAQKLGIAVAASAEKTTVVYSGVDGQNDYALSQVLPKLLKQQANFLRLAEYVEPKKRQGYNGDYNRERYLGSRYVMLVTTDAKTLNEWQKADTAKRTEIKKETRAEEIAAESDAQKKKRIDKEKADELERREERAAFNKEKHDSLWLLAHTAPIVAAQIEIAGPAFLRFVANELGEGRSVSGEYFGEMNAHIKEIDEQIEDTRAQDEKLRLIKERMVYGVLAHAIAGSYGSKPETVYHFGDVCEEVERICVSDYNDEGDERFGIKLPSGWDKPPVHHTAFSCWQCGVFAPGERLTKRDVDEFGWVNLWVEDDADHGGVFCSEAHHQVYLSAQSKSARKPGDAKPGNTKPTKAPKAAKAKRGKK